MFLNEAQSAGVLDNPNILRVFEAGEVDGDPYIVMEFVEGAQTLKDYCTERRDCRSRRRCGFFISAPRRSIMRIGVGLPTAI